MKKHSRARPEYAPKSSPNAEKPTNAFVSAKIVVSEPPEVRRLIVSVEECALPVA